MRSIFALAISLAACTTPAPVQSEPETIWNCACSASCDGVTLTVSLAVCADSEGVAEAIHESAANCASQLDYQCTTHSACACQCNPTGVAC